MANKFRRPRLSLHLSHSPLLEEEPGPNPVFLLTEPTFNELPITSQFYLSDYSLSSLSSTSSSSSSSSISLETFSAASLRNALRVTLPDVNVHKPLPLVPESARHNTSLGASVLALLNLLDEFDADVETQVERLHESIQSTRQFLASIRRERRLDSPRTPSTAPGSPTIVPPSPHAKVQVFSPQPY